MKLFGHEINNWWLIGGGAGVVVVFYLYKRGTASGSSGSAADPNAIDPVTQLPYSMDDQVDPATGLTYLQEAEQYGSVSAAEATAGTGGAFGSSYYPSSGYGYGGGTAGSPTGTSTTSTVSYASNAAWAQAAQAGLASLGYDPTTVAAALGAFLAGSTLTPDQASIVQAAEAEFGAPPVGTFTISVSGTSSGGTSSGGTGSGSGTGTGGSGTGTGGSGGAQVTVPNVIGMTTKQAQASLTAAGLVIFTLPPDVPGFTHVVTEQTPVPGTKVAQGSKVSLTYKQVAASGTSTTGGGTGTAKAPAAAPAGIAAATKGAVTSISWSAVTGASGYEIQLATPKGALFKDVTVSATHAIFDNLVDNGGKGHGEGTWHYKIRAVNSKGSGPWSAVKALAIG